MLIQIQAKVKSLYYNKSTRKICKSMIILFLFLSMIYLFLSNHPCCQTSPIFLANLDIKNPNFIKSPNPKSYIKTNISHLVFGIAGSVNTWRDKKNYIESWWKPNVTRGYLFLDRAPNEYLPWPETSPPVRISGDISRFKLYDHHRMPFAIRMARVVEETFRAERGGVRWYVMADDDTVFFTENLVEVLKKYDHENWYYIGMNSECVISNSDFSYGMAFGGGGYALSYPLAEALANNMDVCLKRYPFLYGSDHILQSCIADLGVSLTQEKGFHQIDLHRDISGLLSSHPQSPVISLHHLDAVDPIFPAMNRRQALRHLLSAAATSDQSRLLQQSICSHHPLNWTFSLSWGYSLHIYENALPSSLLRLPLQTFTEWRKGARPPFIFNTRFLSNDPCQAPHVFYFDSAVDRRGPSEVVTVYSRRWPRRLPPCFFSGNHSADYLEQVRVISPPARLEMVGSRRECCDIVQLDHKNVTTLKLRSCMKNEIIG